MLHEDIIDIDLKTGTVFRSFVNRSIGEGDAIGNRFGARVLMNGEEVDLTGFSVVGYFIRANGTTEVISGSKNGSTCWVDLPEACYTVEGNFQLSIKLTKGATTTTARIVDGTVVNTVLGELNDPGDVIPDLESYETLADSINEAAEIIEMFSVESVLMRGTRYRIEVTTTE